MAKDSFLLAEYWKKRALDAEARLAKALDVEDFVSRAPLTADTLYEPAMPNYGYIAEPHGAADRMPGDE